MLGAEFNSASNGMIFTGGRRAIREEVGPKYCGFDPVLSLYSVLSVKAFGYGGCAQYS